MADKTGIQWTDATWNPVRGCSRVSPGCTNCYAEKVAARFSGPGLAYEGLAGLKVVGDGDNERLRSYWTGEVRLVPHVLDQPRRWQRPRRIFVNSMSDLFHEKLSNEDIAAVFAFMQWAPQHTFQVLTKRAERMADWFRWVNDGGGAVFRLHDAAFPYLGDGHYEEDVFGTEWPLPNVWLGVSVEDQQRADERIPELLATPAAVRFLSCEPLLGPVNLAPALGAHGYVSTSSLHVDWVIVGGESGPGARPFCLGWAADIVEQCRRAGVACFVKQLGADPVAYREPDGSPDDGGDLIPVALNDKKGGDMAEWPEDLRVRQFPEAA